MKMLFAALAIMAISAQCIGAPTVGKPTDVSLTIYNQNFALVKEDRQMTLEKGINFVPVEDVASTIEPTSVAFKSLSDPNSVVVREQNYRYDVVNSNTILDKSVGKKVIVRRIVDGKVQELEGTLLSTSENGRVIQTSQGVLLNPEGEVQVMEMPEGLVSRPTLEWKLEADKSGTQNTEISYLANQMNWVADYVAVIDPLDEFVDLTGWVTLTNNSGTTYENATLNLMAGDVHRVQPPMERMDMYKGGVVSNMAMAAPQFAEKSFFEYHLYTLQNKTTVRNKESKQITLMTAAEIPAKKIYIYDGRGDWWSNYRYGGYEPGESYDVSANKKVTVVMEVVNSKENHLGIPLPKGRIRVYKQDTDLTQQFIGEDEIDHTPKDEKVRLNLGNAFDIVGEHKRTNFRRISDHEVEESFEISLRNHKEQAVTIDVVEHLFSDWRITDSSNKYTKKDASTAEFLVDVPKDGETKITYTVRTKW